MLYASVVLGENVRACVLITTRRLSPAPILLFHPHSCFAAVRIIIITSNGGVIPPVRREREEIARAWIYRGTRISHTPRKERGELGRETHLSNGIMGWGDGWQGAQEDL